MSKVLTPEAQAEREDFEGRYGSDGNCSCHISPPCPSCTHSGNPLNQNEDDTAWMEEITVQHLPSDDSEGGLL
jgi:hypothetical protein